jgi:large subunit ribosomal protein L32
MAVPFAKTSKMRKHKRRTHIKLRVPGMVACDHCGAMKLAHRVCGACGTYKSRTIVSPE